MSAPASSGRRILVIWNPNAGSKAGVPTNLGGESDIRGAIARTGLNAELFESDSAETARDRVRAAIDRGDESFDVIAAAGGDGTAYSIARELMARTPAPGADPAAGGPALGVLPLGSAMNLARALHVPLDIDQAAGILAEGPIKAIDVGLVRGRPFFEIVSIGLAAEALERAQAIDRRRHWGAILEFARLASRYRRTRVRVTLDDRLLRSRALGLAVANGPMTGMHLALAPDARLDDGVLDVVLYEGVGPSGLVAHMLRALVGRPDSTFRTDRGASVRIETRRRMAVYADGLDVGFTPVELSIRPGALRVVAGSVDRDHGATG